MEETKQPLLAAVLAFNVVFMGYQFMFNWYPNFTLSGALLGALTGAVTGGAVFGVMYYIGRQS